MKKQIRFLPLSAVALGLGLLLQAAPAAAAPSAGPPPEKHELLRPGLLWERMSEALGLNPEQKQKIRDILDSERKQAEPHRQALEEGRQEFAAALAKGFDEAAIRQLAAKEAAARTELLVLHLRAKSLVEGVLTPDQRRLARMAEVLLSMPERDRGPRSGRRGCPPESPPEEPRS
ncbi:MAG: Spy/CpxP family protein refolding chaperone [Deltaproteobacteria bacterium]|nr:Spy/CpxP family protein refolding chaperone [Deltaproteobacteria bacterium]